MADLSESLREIMRGWPTGVAVVTSLYQGVSRGLTVNSLASISLDPPCVVISLNNLSRTRTLVMESKRFGVTMLGEDQQHLADIFSGKITEEEDRFAGMETFTLVSGVPFLKLGSAFLDCDVVHIYPLANSTLFVGEVKAVSGGLSKAPLVYLNRGYHQVAK